MSKILKYEPAPPSPIPESRILNSVVPKPETSNKIPKKQNKKNETPNKMRNETSNNPRTAGGGCDGIDYADGDEDFAFSAGRARHNQPCILLHHAP